MHIQSNSKEEKNRTKNSMIWSVGSQQMHHHQQTSISLSSFMQRKKN